jgi:transmembrane sensor
VGELDLFRVLGLEKAMPTRRQAQQLRSLLRKYLRGDCTPEEVRFVEGYWDWFERDPGVFETFTDTEREDLRERLLARIEIRAMEMEEVKVIPFYRKVWVRTAAAAVLIGLIALNYFYGYRPGHGSTPATQAAVKTDVNPGTTRATLILSNGQRILLDTARRGLIAQQGATQVVTGNKGLVYDNGNKAGKEDELRYNTLVTRKGEQYPLVLSDGTIILLDAASSIRYPVAFTGKDRTVEIDGRAWVEVAQDPGKPFFVVKGKQKIEVLGTSFDVNAFDNEADMVVTLVAGKVRVVNAGQTGLLAPGEQAVLANSGDRIQLVEHADVEAATAWKNGRMVFHEADMGAMLRELERWYDIDVEIRHPLSTKKFYFDISRTAKLSEILRLFEIYHLPYSLDAANRKLVVNP